MPTTESIHVSLSPREFDTLIAALRYWQCAIESGRLDPQDDPIATEHGDALNPSQIDTFIERIN